MENLDALDILDLEEFVKQYVDSISISSAEDYFETHRAKVKSEDLLRAMHYHVVYAILRLSASDDRMSGNVAKAVSTEEIMEQIICKMPEFALW